MQSGSTENFDSSRPLILRSKIFNDLWGIQGAAALVAKLGVPQAQELPYSELWVGSHPEAPADAIQGDCSISFADLLSEKAEEYLPEGLIAKFGRGLPYLFKILSIASPLSIQAHPDLKLAETLHSSDPQHYPDRNHKPEIAIALTPFVALCGFRSWIELAEIPLEYPELVDIYGSSNLSEFSNEKADRATALKLAHSASLKSDPEERAGAVNAVVARLKSGEPRNVRDRWFIKLLEASSADDVGMLAFPLLNLLFLEPGEAIFTQPNILHAYLQGEIVECMANSDNVIRAGFTAKYQDSETLVSMLDYNPADTGRVKIRSAEAILEFITPACEFRVSRLNSGSQLELDDTRLPALLFNLDAEASITLDPELEFVPGSAVFFGNKARGYAVSVKSGSVYMVSVPA